jgi:hypothetical protein
MVILLLVGAVAATATVERTLAQDGTPTSSPQASQEEVAVTTPAEPRQVTIGIYLTSIYGLDQQVNTFYADFYLWMRWRGEDDPTATFELLNNVERWGLTMTPIFAEPAALPSGEWLQQFHVQGQFFQPLALGDFPLDEHAIMIQIEDSTFLANEQVYVADLDQSGISPELYLPGWRVTGWSLAASVRRYGTGFGNPTSDAQAFSRAQFALTIARPASYFSWKLLLPLVIVLLLGLSVLIVHPSFAEVRLAGPATALLTLVFLQQTYTSLLPENSNVVLLDKIYAVAYALVIGLLAVTIVTSHWLRMDEANTARAVRLDRIAVIGLFACFVLTIAVLLLPAL